MYPNLIVTPTFVFQGLISIYKDHLPRVSLVENRYSSSVVLTKSQNDLSSLEVDKIPRVRKKEMISLMRDGERKLDKMISFIWKRFLVKVLDRFRI